MEMDGGKNTRTVRKTRLMEVYYPPYIQIYICGHIGTHLVGGHASSINFCVDKTLLLSLAKNRRLQLLRQDIKSQLDPQTMRKTPTYICTIGRYYFKTETKQMDMGMGLWGFEGAAPVQFTLIAFNAPQTQTEATIWVACIGKIFNLFATDSFHPSSPLFIAN